MNIPQTIAISAAVFSILACTLQGQQRSCRLVFPERPNDAPKAAYIFDGKKSRRVTLPSMNLSAIIELPSGELTIAMTPDEINDPKVIPPESPILKLPDTVTDFYIIITPDPKNQVCPVKMNLVDTGGGKLKPGETLWYNFTVDRIVGKLGSAEMSVDPSSRTISRNPIPASGYYAAKFAYQAAGKGEFAPITEQNWWHDANSRHLGFVVNSGGKLPKIFFYRDFRDTETAGKVVKGKFDQNLRQSAD
jgi:hypothetical protein